MHTFYSSFYSPVSSFSVCNFFFSFSIELFCAYHFFLLIALHRFLNCGSRRDRRSCTEGFLKLKGFPSPFTNILFLKNLDNVENFNSKMFNFAHNRRAPEIPIAISRAFRIFHTAAHKEETLSKQYANFCFTTVSL